jgi:glycosyltransferase involved in cell wall biosynthesis
VKVGIYTAYLDKLGLTGPSIYLVHLIEYLLKKRNLDLYLIHHRRCVNKIYGIANEILIPKQPLLGELSLGKKDLDILHFNYIPWGFRTFFPLLKFRKVATSHASVGWSDWTPHPLQKWTQPFTANFLDMVITVSEDLKNRLRSYLRIPEKKITAVYEGVDHSIFKPFGDVELTKVKSKWKLKNRYILHVSNFSKRKNPYALFRTFRYLLKDGFDGELIIVGSGWRNSVSKNLIRALGISDKVRTLGYVAINDLVSLYNLAELALFPSYHENFCFPIVEAMSCGTPVVASDVFSIPEIVGNAAILCDPNNCGAFANATKSILKSEDLKEQMRKRGLELAGRFSWEKCAEETIEIYKRILNH